MARGVLAVLLSLQAAGAAHAATRTAAPPPKPAAAPAEPAVIWTGGDIITMAGASSPQYVQALVTRGGKIVYTGDKAAAMKAAGAGAATRDLGGKTLIPGFSDSHGHLLLAAHSLLYGQLAGAKSIHEILARMKDHAKTVPEGIWIEGMGFRLPSLKEGRWPTKEDLDKVSSTRPVLILDGSGHHAVANSVWLKQMGVTRDIKDPPGGVFYRKAGSSEPDGHFAESAVITALSKRPALPADMVMRGIKKSTDLWMENGYTTAMELGAGASPDDWTFINALIDKKLLPIDLVLLFKAAAVPAAEAAAKGIMDKYKVKASGDPPLGGPRKYLNRVRVHGVKFWMDGSNPTALMSKPYYDSANLPNKNYLGVQNDPTVDLEAAMDKYWKNGPFVVDAHALGDQAIELVIRAMEKAYAKQGPTAKRHVIQHAAMLRPDQIKRIAKLNQTVSFTGGLIGATPDYYLKLYGPERLNWVNPAKSAAAAGVVWGLNSDYPAGPGQDSFLLVQDAVVRHPKVAPQERVTPYQALRAMTYNNAYINNEDRVKGSLEPGKLADLIVLDRNPLKVEATAIRQTKVLETIKEGKTVYKRPASGQLPAAAPPPTEQEVEDGAHQPPPKGTPKLDAAQAAGAAKLLGATAGER